MLEEVVQEILGSILVARLRDRVFRHQVVVRMVPLPRLLLSILGDASFLLPLGCVSSRFVGDEGH